MDDIIVKNIDILVESGTINLKGSYYFNEKTPDRAPWTIVCTGLWAHRGSYFPRFFIEKFVNMGHYVACYDHRAHGETARQTGKNWIKLLPKIFEDIHEVINWILKNQSERLLDSEILLFGRSFSGALIMSQGYIDERAKKIIALCTRYDYRTIKAKFPEKSIDFMSCKNYIKNDPFNNERIFLAHCRDDREIEFFNLLLIKEHLGLSDENVVVFETGGHSFKGHRNDLFNNIKRFLKKL